MKIQFTQEMRGEVERIQREFSDKLSPQQILRATAQSINSALSRTIPQINRGVKEKYNIQQKYLSRMSVVSPKANSSKLYGGIRISAGRLPLVAFRPKQTKSSITVTIHKGKPMIVRNTFVATMASGHKGIFSRGRYTKSTGFTPGRQKTASGKIRITEIRTTSPLKMGVSKSVSEDVQNFMGDQVSARLHGILTSRVNKIAAQNK